MAGSLGPIDRLRRDTRGNLVLAGAIILALLLALAATTFILGFTSTTGPNEERSSQLTTPEIETELTSVFTEATNSFRDNDSIWSFEPVYEDGTTNYTRLASQLDTQGLTREQRIRVQQLVDDLLAWNTDGGVLALEPRPDATTDARLFRTNASEWYDLDTDSPERLTGPTVTTQDLLLSLEVQSLPLGESRAVTATLDGVEVTAWRKPNTTNTVRYAITDATGADISDGTQTRDNATELTVNIAADTINGAAPNGTTEIQTHADTGTVPSPEPVIEINATGAADQPVKMALNTVLMNTTQGGTPPTYTSTFDINGTAPLRAMAVPGTAAFNLTYSSSTATVSDPLRVPTEYRAMTVPEGRYNEFTYSNVTLTVGTENTSQLVPPPSVGGDTSTGGTTTASASSVGTRTQDTSTSPGPDELATAPNTTQAGIWAVGNVWLPDYGAGAIDTTYTATLTATTSLGETVTFPAAQRLQVSTRTDDGLVPCDCLEVSPNGQAATLDPYAMEKSLVLEATTATLPGIDSNVTRNLTIVDPYRKPSLGLTSTAQPNTTVATDRDNGAFSLQPRKTSLPGSFTADLESVSLSAVPAQAVTQFVADQMSDPPTETEMAAAVSGLETLGEQYTDAFFEEGQTAADALLEAFAEASPAEQAAMVNLTGVRAERAIPAFEAINEVVGTVPVNSSDIVAASSPAYAAGAGALVGEPYTAARLPVLGERASHAYLSNEHPPDWWLTRLANTDLSDSQRKALFRLYAPSDTPHWLSQSAWNETILTFINNIQQFRGGTETLWGEGVSDETLEDIIEEVSGGNQTLGNAIGLVHDEMEDVSDLGLNPSANGVSDIEAFLLAAGVTDPEGAAYTEAASLIESLPDDGEPITYEDVLFGMTGDQVQLLDESALGATPPTYELASGADLTADWDAGVTARYTETSPEHGQTLGPYRASDVVTLSGVSSTEIAGLSVRLTDNASVAALRDSGLLNGSEVGPQPLVVDQPREFRVSVTYVNGSTKTLFDPVAAGVNLELVGPTGGGADVPSAPEEFATLDIENNTITAQAATGNWTGTGSSGPITLQASLEELTDTATAQAVNVSVRGAALWRNLSQIGGTPAPGATPRTTVYSDAPGFDLDRKVLRPGVVYTARQGSLATGWHNRTGVPVSPADVGSVTNGNETAASFYTDTQFNPVTEPYTLVAETPSDGWENITVQTISESAALNFSALGYAAPTYDAVAQYNVTCICAESGPAALNPHILTAPGVTSGDLVPSAGSSETISYVDDFVLESPVFPNVTSEVHPAPKADYPSRTHQTPTQTIEETQIGYIYVWSNFEAAVRAANGLYALEEGTVSWRSAWHCNNPGFFGGGESLPSSCWNKSMGMADFTGTNSNGWSSGLNQTGANQDAVGLNITQHEGGSGVHNYTVAPENVSEDKQVNIAVTGNDETINGDAVNTEVWDITIVDTDQSGGGSSPLDVSIDAPKCYPGFEFYPKASMTNIGDSPLTDVDITLKKGGTTIASGTAPFLPQGESVTVQSDEGISASGGSTQLSATASAGDTSVSASWTVDDC